MNTGPDMLAISRAALAASAVAPDDALAAYYLAVSRVTAAKLADELRALELLITARESEFARRVAPPGQLDLEGKKRT